MLTPRLRSRKNLQNGKFYTPGAPLMAGAAGLEVVAGRTHSTPRVAGPTTPALPTQFCYRLWKIAGAAPV